MLSQLRTLDPARYLARRTAAPPAPPEAPPGRALHLLAAPLLLTAAAQTAREAGNPLSPMAPDESGVGEPGLPAAVGWAPLLVAPVAAAAHLTHALHPSRGTRSALRAFDMAAIGAGVVGLLGSAMAARAPRGTGPGVPLAATVFGLAGVFGLLLDRGAPPAPALPVAAAPEPTPRTSLRDRLPRRRRRRQRLVIHV